MASGLFALLDDIAVLARLTATSLDDVAVGALKASAKTAGVIIDDAAVTPQYVQGLSPARELPIIGKITVGSLKNKFLFVIPGAMILSWLAPWVLPFLLILGGTYLVYEGAHKVLSWVKLVETHKFHTPDGAGPELEKKMVSSAVRTDLVLSTEIMLIALSSLEVDNWISKLVMLSLIALGMTLLVYGAVGILVKLDDIGLHLARREKRWVRLYGLSIVRAMPKIFTTLSIVGTLAMLWVGGHLLWLNLGEVGVAFFHDTLHALEEFMHHFHPVVAWFGDTGASMLFGLIVGTVVYYAITGAKKILPRKKNSVTSH